MLVSLEDVRAIFGSAKDRIRHPNNWVRRRGDVVDRRGGTVSPGDSDAVAWSLRGAVMESIISKPSSEILLAPVMNALLDQIAKGRGFRNATDLNDKSSHSEVVTLLAEAILEAIRVSERIPSKEIDALELLKLWNQPCLPVEPRLSLWRRMSRAVSGKFGSGF